MSLSKKQRSKAKAIVESCRRDSNNHKVAMFLFENAGKQCIKEMEEALSIEPSSIAQCVLHLRKRGFGVKAHPVGRSRMYELTMNDQDVWLKSETKPCPQRHKSSVNGLTFVKRSLPPQPSTMSSLWALALGATNT